MASVFSRRPLGYKVGVGLLLLGVMMYVAGFSSPNWYKMAVGLVYLHGGLWQHCTQFIILKVCSNSGFGGGGPGWMQGVQVLMSVGVACLALSVIYVIAVNWVQKQPRHSRLLEMFTTLASGLGLAGTVLFTVQTERNSQQLVGLTKSVRVHGILQKHSVDWSLALCLTSSIICLIATVIVALHNKAVPSEESGGVDYMDAGDVGIVYPVIDVTSQEVYYIPPASAGFRGPPSYETSIATSSHYAAVTSAHYSTPTPVCSQYPSK